MIPDSATAQLIYKLLRTYLTSPLSILHVPISSLFCLQNFSNFFTSVYFDPPTLFFTMSASVDALRPDHILELATEAIQPGGDGQPSLKSSYEAVALIGHACMTAVDFRLVGLGEDHTIGLRYSFSDAGLHD